LFSRCSASDPTSPNRPSSSIRGLPWDSNKSAIRSGRSSGLAQHPPSATPGQDRHDDVMKVTTDPSKNAPTSSTRGSQGGSRDDVMEAYPAHFGHPRPSQTRCRHKKNFFFFFLKNGFFFFELLLLLPPPPSSFADVPVRFHGGGLLRCAAAAPNVCPISLSLSPFRLRIPSFNLVSRSWLPESRPETRLN